MSFCKILKIKFVFTTEDFHILVCKSCKLDVINYLIKSLVIYLMNIAHKLLFHIAYNLAVSYLNWVKTILPKFFKTYFAINFFYSFLLWFH